MRGGPLTRADRLMTEALAQVPADTPPRLRQRFLNTHARIKLALGKLDDSVRLYHEATRLADRQGPDWRRAEQRTALAYAFYVAKQVERASEVSQEVIDLARRAPDNLALSEALNVKGMVLGTQGRAAEELQAMKASIEHARLAGVRYTEVLGLANLADYYLVQGDNARALAVALDALPLARAIKDPSAESVALVNAGLASIGLGRSAEGVNMVRESLMLLARSSPAAAVSCAVKHL